MDQDVGKFAIKHLKSSLEVNRADQYYPKLTLMFEIQFDEF